MHAKGSQKKCLNEMLLLSTIKPVLGRLSKIDKTIKGLNDKW